MLRVESNSHPIPIQTNLELEDEITQKVALQIITELAISIALGFVCAAFTSPTNIPALVIGIAVQLLVNIAIRSYTGYCEYKKQTDTTFETPPLIEWLAPTVFAQGSWNGHVLIHESGHALAANALLQNPQPFIELFPYSGGVTYFRASQLAELGQKLGPTNSRMAIAAAGPLLSLGVSTIMLSAGLGLTESAPETSRFLIVSSIINFLVHALYAISALFASRLDLSHDFIALWSFGIHPLVSTIAIIALPILLITHALS